MNRVRKSILLFLCTFSIFTLTACDKDKPVELPNLDINQPFTDVKIDDNTDIIVEDNSDEFNKEEGKIAELSDPIEVNFIDVGQGDSCFIVTANNDTILIDAGEKSDALAIIECLDEYEFEDIDLMILTHPDADHIAGAKTILETYDVAEVVMCSYVKNTKMFENLIACLENLDTKVTQGQVGLEYNIDGVNLLVVGVDSNVKTANDSSVVTKMTYGDVSIMFMGDLEEKGEKVVLQNGYDLSAQIMKLGHHGSSTSSSQEMLDVVNPKIAIISCGLDNKYGHPHVETKDKLDTMGIKYYRTDELGTIKLEIDGINITTILNDSLNMNQMLASRNFLFSPDVASVEIVPETEVLVNLELAESKVE